MATADDIRGSSRSAKCDARRWHLLTAHHESTGIRWQSLAAGLACAFTPEGINNIGQVTHYAQRPVCPPGE